MRLWSRRQLGPEDGRGSAGTPLTRMTPVDCEFEADPAVATAFPPVRSLGGCDDAGRTSRSELTRWVAGGTSGVRSHRVELEAASLIPDSDTYEAGDVADPG